jgi:hypothetical protein
VEISRGSSPAPRPWSPREAAARAASTPRWSQAARRARAPAPARAATLELTFEDPHAPQLVLDQPGACNPGSLAGTAGTEGGDSPTVTIATSSGSELILTLTAPVNPDRSSARVPRSAANSGMRTEYQKGDVLRRWAAPGRWQVCSPAVAVWCFDAHAGVVGVLRHRERRRPRLRDVQRPRRRRAADAADHARPHAGVRPVLVGVAGDGTAATTASVTTNALGEPAASGLTLPAGPTPSRARA